MDHYHKSYIEELQANMEELNKQLEQAENREQDALETQKKTAQKLEKLKADVKFNIENIFLIVNSMKS